MDSQSFFSGFVKLRQVFFQCGEEGFSQGGIGAWFIAIEEGKWRCFGGAVRGRVVVEFSRGEELYPFGRVIGTEDAEIGLEFLIGPFSLSIGLRVVGGGELYIVVEEAC